MSTLGEAVPLTLGASCDIETFLARSEEREDDGTEDEAGDDEMRPFDVDDGDICVCSSTSIPPCAPYESATEPEPEAVLVLLSGTLVPASMVGSRRRPRLFGGKGMSTPRGEGMVDVLDGPLVDGPLSSRGTSIDSDLCSSASGCCCDSVFEGVGSVARALSTGSAACVYPPCDLIRLV